MNGDRGMKRRYVCTVCGRSKEQCTGEVPCCGRCGMKMVLCTPRWEKESDRRERHIDKTLRYG